MFIVTLIHNGKKYPLRRTVWAFDMDRATTHATREEATAALGKAKMFMTAAQFRAAQIEEV